MDRACIKGHSLLQEWACPPAVACMRTVKAGQQQGGHVPQLLSPFCLMLPFKNRLLRQAAVHFVSHVCIGWCVQWLVHSSAGAFIGWAFIDWCIHRLVHACTVEAGQGGYGPLLHITYALVLAGLRCHSMCGVGAAAIS